MVFVIAMDMQTFAFVNYIFSSHQHLGFICTMLHDSSRFPSMSQHQYKHKFEVPHPRDGLISYIPCRIKFSFFGQVEKKQVYCVFKHYDFTNDED
jgi:hypothetical protein